MTSNKTDIDSSDWLLTFCDQHEKQMNLNQFKNLEPFLKSLGKNRLPGPGQYFFLHLSQDKGQFSQ